MNSQPTKNWKRKPFSKFEINKNEKKKNISLPFFSFHHLLDLTPHRFDLVIDFKHNLYLKCTALILLFLGSFFDFFVFISFVRAYNNRLCEIVSHPFGIFNRFDYRTKQKHKHRDAFAQFTTN